MDHHIQIGTVKSSKLSSKRGPKRCPTKTHIHQGVHSKFRRRSHCDEPKAHDIHSTFISEKKMRSWERKKSCDKNHLFVTKSMALSLTTKEYEIEF